MASWDQTAMQSFNRGVTSSNMDRGAATKLRSDIDFWAGTIGAMQNKTFSVGRYQFAVRAKDHKVEDVNYSMN